MKKTVVNKSRSATVPCPKCGFQISPAALMVKLRNGKLTKARRKDIASAAGQASAIARKNKKLSTTSK